jgi:Carboxypeptidase regulatory-like domain/TonB-dependent Receptor Plug Domain/TonB dependent receptor
MLLFRRLLVCVAALLVSVFIAFAQTETGQIAGTVSDPSGAAVPNATVTAKSPTTGVARTTKSFGTGVYTLTDLLPGPYDVSVTAEGFNKVQQRVTVTVGGRVGQDFRLEVGATSTVVEVSGTATTVDTETQTLGQVVTGNQIRELPNLTRNPYQFVALAGNASDGGMGTRGAGFSINGQRESSTNLLLDGAANNDEFSGNIGQQVPLDALQEFSVLTSNFTAEYGRASGGIVNVVTKAGTNQYHGTAYEFNRVSSLSSNSFQNNANAVPESVFVRNQFGYSAGGPVKKNKLFFFSSTEWTRVRSNATQFAWVADPALLALTPANTQNFFSTLGGLRSNASVIGTVNLNDLTTITGGNPCTPSGKAPLLCASLPGTTALFDHVTYSVPFDAGGGTPQNTYNTLHRMDYNISDNTQLYARYALFSEVDQSGALSSSPYSGYDLGQTFFNHNALVSVIHTFSPRWVSQSKVVYNRLTNLQDGFTAARGIVPTMYPNTTGAVSIGPDNIAFPGYNPFTPGNGGAFGGPQNILQFYEDMTFTRGGHSLRFGVTYENMRDNRTYAAYQTAVDALGKGGIGPSLSGLLAGSFTDIKAAVSPQGQFPGGTVTLPLGPPSFSRSNRFHDGAAYVQDSWKVRPGITVNFGLRWEYFGVQHNANQALDSNWYAPGIGFADPSLAQYLNTGTIQLAQKSSVGAMWDPSKKNFAPRIGFAWDIFGDGKTSFRAGYGIGYERNFGNVTFNLIQNPPNYAVLDVPGPITTANFGPLAGSGGTLTLPHVGARIVDPNIKTAYAHIWSASIERQVTKDVVYSLEYSGSKGVNLYTISYPNQGGFGNNNLGIPCTGNGDCTAQPNSNWGANVGYRGNEGFSIYHGLNNKLTVRNFKNTGLDLSMNYTWSHAIDNQSSTFFEAAGVQNQYGNSNITTNNGNFGLGLLDPYHPNLDRGDAEFDLRQRVTMAANWRVPFRGKGIAEKLLGGWSLNPLFVAHTGQPYSIFNCESPLTLNYNCERAVFNGPIPTGSNGLVPTATPDSYNWLTLTQAQINMTLTNPMTPGSPWPSSMSGRDAFRAPGWWNLDFGVFKDTKITERFSLQLRGEVFNLFNHANLYVVGNSADIGAANSITACYGCTTSSYDRRNMQLAAKLIF